MFKYKGGRAALRSGSQAGGKPVGEMLSQSGSGHAAGMALTCPWSGPLHQHVPVPCPLVGTVPCQCRASVLWHGHGNSKGHPHVGFCWHTTEAHRKPSPPKGMRPWPAPALRGGEGSSRGCHGGQNLHRALPAQRPGEWHGLKHVLSWGGHSPTDTAGALSTKAAQAASIEPHPSQGL